jgi:hypothetical protein
MKEQDFAVNIEKLQEHHIKKHDIKYLKSLDVELGRMLREIKKTKRELKIMLKEMKGGGFRE